MENSAYLALPLFAGLAAGDIPAALAALDALCRPFAKGETLLEAGQRGAPMGVVLAGRVLIEHLDLWGNRTLLGRAAEGELFAETYAFLPDQPMLVSVVAAERGEALFLDPGKLMAPGCEPWRWQMMQNLLHILAGKNLNLARRSLYTAPKTIRERVTACLSRVHGEALIDKRVGALSGGELQRVLLAMALELKANAADLADCEVQAIRLGGGSASIINGSDLDHLLRLIRSCYHVAENAPVTMRTCPADINGANMPFYNRSHVTRYDLELYSLEPLDFCTLDTLNYSEQMPYITHGFLRADRRDSMGFVLLYGKKTVSRWGFRHSVLEVTRRPVCHVLLQRCAGADMLDDAAAQAQLDEAAQLLTEAGFVQYLPRRWAKPGCEDKFWQGAANGMDVLAFGLSAYTRLDGMITTNTSDLNTYLAHSADYEQITVSTVPVQTAE